jgi:hypothetical protein
MNIQYKTLASICLNTNQIINFQISYCVLITSVRNRAQNGARLIALLTERLIDYNHIAKQNRLDTTFKNWSEVGQCVHLFDAANVYVCVRACVYMCVRACIQM